MQFEEPWNVEDASECIFYHTMEIPGYGIVEGEWDLRGDIAHYLGGVDLSGKQVLEIGPASGFVTFWLEQMGAEVTVVDIDERVPWDFVPFANMDLSQRAEQRRFGMRALKRGFWLAHKAHRSKSRVLYANVYELPAELGQFDIGVLGLLLLHLRDPLSALEKCARHVKTIVVTELLHAPLADSPVCQLLPSIENRMSDTWWALSPRLIVQYLEVLGFSHFTVTTHEACYRGSDYPLYTVVGNR
jgi:O-methyltransferase